MTENWTTLPQSVHSTEDLCKWLNAEAKGLHVDMGGRVMQPRGGYEKDVYNMVWHEKPHPHWYLPFLSGTTKIRNGGICVAERLALVCEGPAISMENITIEGLADPVSDLRSAFICKGAATAATLTNVTFKGLGCYVWEDADANLSSCSFDGGGHSEAPKQQRDESQKRKPHASKPVPAKEGATDSVKLGFEREEDIWQKNDKNTAERNKQKPDSKLATVRKPIMDRISIPQGKSDTAAAPQRYDRHRRQASPQPAPGRLSAARSVSPSPFTVPPPRNTKPIALRGSTPPPAPEPPPAPASRTADRSARHRGTSRDGSAAQKHRKERGHADKPKERHARRCSRSRERSRDDEVDGKDRYKRDQKRRHRSPVRAEAVEAATAPERGLDQGMRETQPEGGHQKPPRPESKHRKKDKEERERKRERDSEQLERGKGRESRQRERERESRQGAEHCGKGGRDRHGETGGQERDVEKEGGEGRAGKAEETADRGGKERRRRRTREPRHGRGRRSGSVNSVGGSSSSDSGIRAALMALPRASRHATESGRGASGGVAEAGVAARGRVEAEKRGSGEPLQAAGVRSGSAGAARAADESPVGALPAPPRRGRPHMRDSAGTGSKRYGDAAGAADRRDDGAAARDGHAAHAAVPSGAGGSPAERPPRPGGHDRALDVAPAVARHEHRPGPPEGRLPAHGVGGVGGIRGTSDPGQLRPPTRRETPHVHAPYPPPPPPAALPGPPPRAPVEEAVGRFMPRQQRGASEDRTRAAREPGGRSVPKSATREGLMGEDLMGDAHGAPAAQSRDARAWRAADGDDIGGAFVTHDGGGAAPASDAWRPHADGSSSAAAAAAGADWVAPQQAVADGYLAAAEEPAAEEPVRGPLQVPGYTVGESAGLRAQMAAWKQAAQEVLRYVPLAGGKVSEVFSRLDGHLGPGAVGVVRGGERDGQMRAVQRHCGAAGLAGWLPVHQGRRRGGGEEEVGEEQWREEVRESADAVFACSEALKREREAGWSAMGSDGAFIHGGKGAAIVFAGAEQAARG
eukprot:jgi/Ulvmu1/9179/UM005_0279.1